MSESQEEYFKIYDTFATEELIRIYRAHDLNVYKEEALAVIAEILKRRDLDINALPLEQADIERKKERDRGAFLLSFLPTEKLHLLFIMGTLCSLISPFLNWLPRSLVSDSMSISDSFAYTSASRVLVLYSAFASLILCLYRTRNVMRNFLLTMISALAGLFTPLNLSTSFYDLPLGFHTALAGIILISMGLILLKLKAKEDSLPITLATGDPWERGYKDVEARGPSDKEYARMFAVAIILVTSLGIGVPRFIGQLVGAQSPTYVFPAKLIYLLYLLAFAITLLSTPGFLALLMRWKISREGFRDAGFQLGRLRWYLIAVLVPLLIYAVSYVILFALGFYIPETWKEPYEFRSLAESLSLRFTGWILILLFLAFGEELGWRSYLQPKLVNQFGFSRGIFLVALVWWLWHIPADLAKFSPMGSLLHSPPLIEQVSGILSFLIMRVMFIMAFSFVLGYLYIRSGSVFTVTVMHGSINVIDGLGISFTKYDYVVKTAVWLLGAYLLLRKQRLKIRYDSQ